MFRINHRAVMAQVNVIQGLADNLQAQLNRCNAVETELRSGWQGRASNAFLARVSLLRSELSTQRNQMVALANTIRETANAIQRADQAAVDRANALATSMR
jgi:WXG100 family type VII secretion target